MTPEDAERGSVFNSPPPTDALGQPWAVAATSGAQRQEYQTNPLGGPLGANGPAAGGMMPLTDAVAAQAEMAPVGGGPPDTAGTASRANVNRVGVVIGQSDICCRTSDFKLTGLG
jgi:hypothetical protein